MHASTARSLKRDSWDHSPSMKQQAARSTGSRGRGIVL